MTLVASERDVDVKSDSATGVTSICTSCCAKASKGTRRSGAGAVPKISPGSRSIPCGRDCLLTRADEVFRGLLAVVSGNNIHHIEAGECEGSVKTNQVYRDQLWCNVERHAWPIVYKVVGSVRCLTTVNIRGSAVTGVAKSVRKGEFAEKATVGRGRKRFVGARVETHPTILTKQEGTSHCLIGDDVYPYRK